MSRRGTRSLETGGVALMAARPKRFFVAGVPKILAVAVFGLAVVSPSYSGTTTYSYDVQGRLGTVTAPANGSDQSITTYSYDNAGNRATVVASIVDNTPPNAPTGLTATALTSQQIRLNWTPSVDVGGGPVSYYKVYRGGTVIASPSTPPFDDWPLTPNTAYSYAVSAVDGVGHESAQSGSAGATTPPDTTPPTAPTNLQGVAVSGTTVNLTWSASQDSGGSLLAGYEVFRNNGGSPIGTTSATNYSDQTASPGVTYQYNVRAYDGAGNRSSFSNQISVTTPDTVAPSAPGNPTFGSVTVNSATATWTAASDNVGVTGYRYSLNGGASWTNVGNVLSVGLTGLTSGTHYTMLVEAEDAAGNWGSSSSGSFTTVYIIATGSRPPTVQPAYAGTYGCQYYIDYYYYIEYESCYVLNGGTVYYQYYSPPMSPWVDTGYTWTGSSLLVDSSHYGTY
jgi:chitodextrinase